MPALMDMQHQTRAVELLINNPQVGAISFAACGVGYYSIVLLRGREMEVSLFSYKVVLSLSY